MPLSCRAMGDVSDRIGRPTDSGQVRLLYGHKFRCNSYLFSISVVFHILVSVGQFTKTHTPALPMTLQIGIIDPDCRLIGLHLYDGLFKVCGVELILSYYKKESYTVLYFYSTVTVWTGTSTFVCFVRLFRLTTKGS